MHISLLTQSANFIQSNDVIYRTVLDLVGFDIPTYAMGRNKNERREILTHLSIFTLFGFLLAPLNAFVLNKVMGKKYLDNKTGLFLLNWKHLDPGKEHEALKHLEHWQKEYTHRLHHPVGIYKNNFLKNRLKQSLQATQQAIQMLHEKPTILKDVYKAKKGVLLIDVLYTSITLGMIGPLKNMVTRVFAHKDRFTGTENYLSDEDLKKVTKGKKKNKTLEKAINVVLFASPLLIATLAHGITRKKIQKGENPSKLLLKIRDSMDYTGGLYMTLGALFPIALVKNLSLVNAARDKYERFETVFRYALGMPTFWFGDPLFNGNVAKITDKWSHKKHGTPLGTFYDVNKSGKLLVHSKHVNDVIAQVTGKYGHEMGKKAGNIASGIFYTGLALHNLMMSAVIVTALTITRSRVLRDLAIFTKKEPSQKSA